MAKKIVFTGVILFNIVRMEIRSIGNIILLGTSIKVMANPVKTIKLTKQLS